MDACCNFLQQSKVLLLTSFLPVSLELLTMLSVQDMYSGAQLLNHHPSKRLCS